MTKEERQQLSALIAQLENVQAEAPTKTTYGRGRTDSSISYKLLNIIQEMKDIVAYEPESPTGEPDTETTPA